VDYAFTQIQITDVKNQKNYQKVTPIVPRPGAWAQYDPKSDWYVKLFDSSDPSNGNVNMKAIDKNPMNMAVVATFIDAVTKTACKIELQLYQQGAPLLVWGTGQKMVNPKGKTPIEQYNYYYSFTHLKASGTITIGTEKIAVTGLTWMDHEYGAFTDSSGASPLWTLQDVQLTDDIHLSNYTAPGVIPKENVPMDSSATLLIKGKSIFVEHTKTTPMAPFIKSAKGITYFLKYKVEIDCPELRKASFIVTSLFPDQIFKDPGTDPDVYEGVASCNAQFGATTIVVTGDAWLEQSLG
jgi:hypothetical protein